MARIKRWGDNATAAPGELVAIFDDSRAKVAAVLLLALGGSNAMLILLKEKLFSTNQAVSSWPKQIILTWWRTSVRAALQVKSQPGSLQKCSPWFQSFPSLSNIVQSEIFSSGPLILLFFSTNLSVMNPCMRSHISLGFPSVLTKLHKKCFITLQYAVCQYIWGSFPEGVYIPIRRVYS